MALFTVQDYALTDKAPGEHKVTRGKHGVTGVLADASNSTSFGSANSVPRLKILLPLFCCILIVLPRWPPYDQHLTQACVGAMIFLPMFPYRFHALSVNKNEVT